MDWLDRAAMAELAGCMVHCLALPILLAVVPAVSAFIVIPESFHRWVLLFAAPIASIAFVGGHARHAVSWPLCVGAAGLGLMTIGALALPEGGAEIAATVTGGILLALAHTGNLRLHHSCGSLGNRSRARSD